MHVDGEDVIESVRRAGRLAVRPRSPRASGSSRSTRYALGERVAAGGAPRSARGRGDAASAQREQVASGAGLEIAATLPVKMIRDAYDRDDRRGSGRNPAVYALAVGHEVLIGATDEQILKIAHGARATLVPVAPRRDHLQGNGRRRRERRKPVQIAKKTKSKIKTKPETVLILRVCRKDGSSSRGFKWPTEGVVEAPDWDPRAECGRGLHGWLWGDGDVSVAGGLESAIPTGRGSCVRGAEVRTSWTSGGR